MFSHVSQCQNVVLKIPAVMGTTTKAVLSTLADFDLSVDRFLPSRLGGLVGP